MNRDCNIEELAYESQSGCKIVKLSDLQDWLTDKKVIKKGLHPHPYADVLHELAERPNNVTVIYTCNDDTGFVENVEYRIKPQEPVYECQYVFVKDGKEIMRSCYMTVDEFEESRYFSAQWDTDEETKRERK